MPIDFDDQSEQQFFARFNELNPVYYTKGKTQRITISRPENRNQPFDFALSVGGRIYAIIEIKRARLLSDFKTTRLENYAVEQDIRLVIVTDGQQSFQIIDTVKQEKLFQQNFEKFINVIQGLNEQGLDSELFDIIRPQIASIIYDLLNDYETNFGKDFADLYNQILSQIEFDSVSQRFSFINPLDINSVENRIFLNLIGDADTPDNKVYRYTSISTAHSMLSNNSFRINCLVGMNDITEVSYAEEHITGSPKTFTNRSSNTIEAYNNRFISSCSLKSDDLTQWRLYAEDCKGVCLVLRIGDKSVNKKQHNNFIVKRISYGNADGTHKELDLIKNIISTIRSILRVNFYFKTITTWRHFFKPFEYAVEQEVRVLYIRGKNSASKKGWLLTSTHNILNPYVDFELNSSFMPVSLIEIVLGPKCPEKELNKIQFEQYIRELRREKTNSSQEGEKPKYNLNKLKISISKITSYR